MEDKKDLDRLTVLGFRYISGYASPEEEQELNAYLEIPGNRARFDDIVSKEGFLSDQVHFQDAEDRQKHSLTTITKEFQYANRGSTIVSLRRWGLVAAVAAGVVLSYMLFKQSGKPSNKQVIASVPMRDLLPGGRRATLTLSTGQEIVLDSLKKGEVGEDAGSKIVRAGSGRITYSNLTHEKPLNTQGEVSYNTLKTPKGGTYEIVLPDHSKVYLNSASSLKYPTVFSNRGPRVVELTGEAYFEAQHDPSRPFQVLVYGKRIEALGTIFNVNAYEDEPSINATLIEGSVRVSDSVKAVLLSPGQQAQMTSAQLRVVNEVDTESVVAWKNGDFRFMSGVPLDEVLKQLSRWYNVDVAYIGEKPSQKFFGVVSRNLPASEVFKALERSGYHFKIVANKIEVSQ